MLFSGGLIPTYLLIQNLNLVNSFPVLFLPAMVNVYNMLIIKNNFEGLPDELEESAKLDGAGNIRILVSVIIPLSLPVMARGCPAEWNRGLLRHVRLPGSRRHYLWPDDEYG